MTVLGPLTTTFKAPSTCTAATPQIYQIWTGSESRYEQGPLLTSGSDCFPSAYDASPQNYYSPGFCPHGYTAACSSTNTIQTRTAEETVLVCCPTALVYTCLDPGSTASASWGCTTALAGAHANIGVTVISDGITSGYTVVSETRAAFAAHSIQVRFVSGDLPQPTGDSTTTAAAAFPKTTVPPTLPTGLLAPNDPPPPPPLSTPAAIGIGIGAALAFVALLGALTFFVLRRRRRRPPAPDDHTNRPFSPPPVPPKDPYRVSTYTHHTAATGGGGGVYELSTPPAAAAYRKSHQAMHAGPFYHVDDEDDDKSTRTLTGMGGGGGGGGVSTVGGGGGRRSRTNTMGTARSEETARAVVREGEETRFPTELAGNARVQLAELEGGRGVVAELEGSGSESGPAAGRSSGAGLGVGLGIQRPQSLMPPAPIGGGGGSGRPVSAASSSAGWTVMRREGVQATPWL